MRGKEIRPRYYLSITKRDSSSVGTVNFIAADFNPPNNQAQIFFEFRRNATYYFKARPLYVSFLWNSKTVRTR